MIQAEITFPLKMYLAHKLVVYKSNFWGTGSGACYILFMLSRAGYCFDIFYMSANMIPEFRYQYKKEEYFFSALVLWNIYPAITLFHLTFHYLRF